VLASRTLRARGREPRGAAKRPPVSGRAAGPARGKTEEGARGKKRLTGGTSLAEEEGRRGRSGGGVEGNGWAAVRSPRGEGERREGERAARLRREREREKRGGPSVAHAGGRRGKEARERERERVWAAGLSFLSFSFSFFFSTLKLAKQFYLNSNEFEFKPYKLNTIKTMLQHECTSKLIL
jgi:hypothetical protein